MFKTKILLATCLCGQAFMLHAQQTSSYAESGKYRLGLDKEINLLRERHNRVVGMDSPTVWAKVLCSDAEAVSSKLKAWGVYHSQVSDSLITAQIPVAWADSIYALPHVVTLTGSIKAYPLMNQALTATKGELVHRGHGLETPFTGKDVLLCIIDVGAELNHPAFSDANGKLRVKYFWDRNRSGSTPITTEQAIRAAKYDNVNERHGTHVMGIAGGSVAPGNISITGQAPDADLMFISSTFMDSELMDNLTNIQAFAKKQGKPCVVNMSFGTMIGGHNGLDDVDKVFDSYSGEGMVLVQASGNSNAAPIHVYGLMGGASKPLRVALKPDSQRKNISMVLYTRDKVEPLMQFKMYAYNPNTKTKKDITALFKQRGGVYSMPDADGRWSLMLMHSNHAEIAKTGEYLLVEFYNEKNQTLPCDVWTEAFYDTHFLTYEPVQAFAYVPADTEYQIEPFGRRTLQVASYTTRNKWNTLNGKGYEINDYVVGDISPFSSGGPVVGEWYAAPVVAAPGSLICSAYSKTRNSNEDLANSTYVLYKTQQKGENFYYGLMQGTSMACPQVAGIVACWLQADPTLTPERIQEIIKATAQNDSFTGDARNVWDRRWGYGKIDAYEGLKMVLGMSTHVRDVWNSAEPISIQRNADNWQLLFNSCESQVDIRLTTTAGMPVCHRSLKNVMPGHEEVVQMNGLPHGVYLLTVKTNGAFRTRTFVY